MSSQEPTNDKNLSIQEYANQKEENESQEKINQNQENSDIKQQDFKNQELNYEQMNFQQPKYMYKYYFDKQTQEWKFNNFMFPDYYKYFKEMQKNLQQLALTINKKWSPQEKTAYIQYLTDVNNYIRNYIWTKQIVDFNVFYNAMQQYSENNNLLGAQLYQSQLQYLHKKSEGYNFFQDKKKNKANKANTQVKNNQNNWIKKQNTEKKEEQIQRDSDPQINVQQLRQKKWSQEKYLNIDLFLKENANLVFIGHVDSGKSTLTGNILKELGQVDEQQWIRNKQQAKQNHMQAWQLAGVADVDPNQRKRGKTIEYAKVMFHYQERRFTVFDAPGHKNYVPNMIMGACQADIAVLIISAKVGQFQSGFVKDGQTQEHALLAKSLGVSSLIVAITKMDTVDWSEKRYHEIKNAVLPFLQNVCGYQKCEFIPIDSISNKNVHKPIQCSWWKGKYLLKALSEIKLPQRSIKGPLRIPVIDKFKDVGNLYIYGKLQSGALIEEQTVTLLPQRKQFVVKQIFNAKDERLPYAIAGQNLKLRVKGIQESEIKRGNCICNNKDYCQQSKQFKAELKVLELPEKKKLVSSGYQCILHLHAASQSAQIAKVQSKVDKNNNKLIPATFLLPDETGHVIIKIQNPLCLQKFQFMPNLARFTLRDEGKTIGYGHILKIKPAKALLKEQKEHLQAKIQQKQEVK